MQTNTLQKNSDAFNRFYFINCFSHAGKLSALDNVKETCFSIQMIKIEIALRANAEGTLQYRRN